VEDYYAYYKVCGEVLRQMRQYVDLRFVVSDEVIVATVPVDTGLTDNIRRNIDIHTYKE